ncbi:FUN14 domain-containing protein 2 [Alligator mississippiensis]|uniref:FUN14 domain-containing protein 2 n=1 Tax=Alligator mississippiensis TaxID=8496 RepID=A0A151P7T2_ALLMI|nr:FUN14 domain-containing protein 2 [Alligator mississippiensis]
MAAGGGKNEDSYKVLDLTEYTKNQSWWRKLFAPHSGSSAEKYNVATQLVIGGVTGWCTGFIFQKVGKLAATAVGGGFFLLQIANHKGYIKVDWKLVERDVNKAKQQLKFHSSGTPLIPETKSRADEVITFLKKNEKITEKPLLPAVRGQRKRCLKSSYAWLFVDGNRITKGPLPLNYSQMAPWHHLYWYLYWKCSIGTADGNSECTYD